MFNVDLHHPVVLAKELATLDLLSDGRLEVGLGAGWVAAEYEGLDVTMDRPGVRIARLGEVVELMKAHWSGEDVAVDGTYVHAPRFHRTPPTGAATAPAGPHRRRAGRILTLAGRMADIVSFNYDNSSGRLGAGSVASAGAAETAQKVEWVRAGAGDRFDDIEEPEMGAYFVAVDDHPAPSSRRWPNRSGSTSRPSTTTPTPSSAASTRSATRSASGGSGYGISYVTIAQRNVEAFAPVVARMAGT